MTSPETREKKRQKLKENKRNCKAEAETQNKEYRKSQEMKSKEA